MFCPKCGKQIIEGAAFCMHCGSAVVQLQEEAPRPAASEQVNASAQPVAEQLQTPPQPVWTQPQTPPQPAQPQQNPQPQMEEKPKKKKSVGGIILLVFGVLAILGGISNGFYEDISDSSDYITIALEVGCILGGIYLIGKDSYKTKS